MKMIQLNWGLNDNKEVGKSSCGNFLVELINKDSVFHYTITVVKNKKVYHEKTNRYKDIQELKKAIELILSIRYGFGV
jgi:hypothetical protein